MLDVSTDGTDPRLMSLFGLNTGKVSVTEESVLSISTVYACIDRIGKTIASMPWDVLIADDDRSSRKYQEHACYRLLHTQPHPLYTSSTFRRVMINHLLLTGNFFAEIQADGRNRPIALKIWQRHEVSVYKLDDRLYYKLSDGRTLQDYQVIHLKNFSLDGLVGRSPLRVNMDTFKTSLQTQRFGADFYENGTRLSGMVTTEKNLKSEQRSELAREFNENYGTKAGGSGKTAFLSDGFKYQPIGIAPDEAQYLETRKFSRTEICAIYGVPPHMVMDLENATFSNIENQNIWYATHTISPIITDAEQEFDRKLFRESEQGTVYNKLNMHGLLRGDTAAQTAHISSMVDRGIYSRNEARSLLDKNPYEGGDEYLVQGAMTPVDLLRGFYETKIKAGDTKPTVTP